MFQAICTSDHQGRFPGLAVHDCCSGCGAHWQAQPAGRTGNVVVCTVTWWRNSSGYGVLFNRDEARTRMAGQPPAVRHLQGCSYLSPIDSDAGGTWIWTNEHGVTACILNNYPRHVKTNELVEPVSRGLLLASLACMGSGAMIGEKLIADDLRVYRPFFILVFDDYSIFQFGWDGEELEKRSGDKVTCPLTTTGYRPEEVIAYRHELFARAFTMDPDRSPEDLAAFHSRHDPEKPAHSVLMAREDACTISQSRVRVTGQQVEMTYYPVEHVQLQSAASASLNRV